MFRKPLLLSLAIFASCAVPVLAQKTPTPDVPTDKTNDKTAETPGPNRFWQASLAGGNYMVALDKITAVSRHKYVLDGALLVDEVTVDTVGQSLVRFYYISPITDAMPGNTATALANRGKQLLDTVASRAGTDIQNMVQKKYPETTHAKEVEYRVLSEGELSSLYSSVRSAWESGRGRQFSIK